MCGGSTKTTTPPPPPAPAPQPMPSDVSPMATSEQRKNRINALKYGAMSTIKTSPQGLVGAGPELNTPAATGGKKNLGS